MSISLQTQYKNLVARWERNPSTDLENQIHAMVKRHPEVLAETQPDENGCYECTKCGGSGIWTGRNRLGEDRCYRCDGTGRQRQAPKKMDFASARNRVNARNRKARKAEEAQARLDAFCETPVGACLKKAAASGFEFAQSLLDSYRKYGELTERQTEAAENMLAKQQARQAKLDAQKVSVGELAGIRAMFEKALESGLKRPKVIVGDLRISLAPANGNNAGYLYVKYEHVYQGKISKEGLFSPVRDARDEVAGELAAIADAPEEALRAHGQHTGECGLCGRELTDPESIARGIGPVCADRYGF